MLYSSVKKPDGSFIHIKKNILDKPYKIIVVDEISMLPLSMWELLLSHRVHIIACGDPGQLPPIGEDNGVLRQPHIFLDEIMRQAAESEIIRISADIRAGKPIKPFKGEEVNIVTRSKLCEGMLLWADQIICGKNDTRRWLNSYYRQLKWNTSSLDSIPLIGDKIICLKNNWKKVTEAGDALVNGTIGTLTKIEKSRNRYLDPKITIDFHPDVLEESILDNDFHKLILDYKFMVKGEPTITKDNFKSFPFWLNIEQFDYGYAITCHKSQGSEYNKVLLLEEKLKATEHAKWLYTGVTRAVERLTLVLKE